MATREIHLELLIDKPVRDQQGKSIGRIEEIRARRESNEWIIHEYLVGPGALLTRLSAWSVGMAVLRLFGARPGHGGYRIAWDKIDLTDPDKLRLRCGIDECEILTEQPQDPNWFSADAVASDNRIESTQAPNVAQLR